MSNFLKYLIWTFVLSVVMPFSAQSVTFGFGGFSVIVPSGVASRDGNTWTLLPFLGPGDGRIQHLGPIRYQQVFGLEDFAPFPDQGAYLFSAFVRCDCLHNNLSTISSNAVITISTTSRKPDQLSTMFSENRGGDESVFRSPSSMPFPRAGVSGCVGGAPSAFNGRIDKLVPFYYNPKNGSLLLEVVSDGIDLSRVAIRPLTDAEDTIGDAVSRVVSYSTTNRIAQVQDSIGIPMQFEFSPVPYIQTDIETNTLILSWPNRVPNTISLQWSQTVGAKVSWDKFPGRIDNHFDGVSMTYIPQASLIGSRFFRLLWSNQPGAAPAPGLAEGDSPISSDP